MVKPFALCVFLLFALAACGSAPDEAPEPPPTRTTAPALELITATLRPTAAELSPTPTPSPSLVMTASPTAPARAGLDAAHFLSETLPDYSKVQPGQTFRKSWRISNNGATTWTEGYSLFFVSSSPAGERLNSPEWIPLPASVAPGGEVEISVDLTAPTKDGVYTVYYGLRNASGEHFLVDGGNLWVTVTVGNPPLTAAATGGNLAYAPQLLSWNQTAQSTEVRFCMQLPDSTPSWFPFDMALFYGGNRFVASGAGVVNYQPGSWRCFRAEFGVGTAVLGQAGELQVSIGGISIDAAANQKENCVRAQGEVRAAHPGVEFNCGSPGLFYSLIQKPAGMSDAEADQIIMDALERRVYGPWVLSLNS